MSNVKTWATTVGFKTIGEEAYRGRIHSSHLESVQMALTEMGLTQACKKDNFEIWSSEDDEEVVLINHSS